MLRGDAPPGPALTVSRDVTDPARPAVMVAGDLDFQTAPRLWDELDQLFSGSPERVTVDVSGLRFVDSTGLAVIVQSWRTCQSTGTALSLDGVPRFLANILRITGIADLLTRQAADAPRPATTVDRGADRPAPAR